MSRHPPRNVRISSKLNFLGYYTVASKWDLRARKRMERAGFVLDDREDAEPKIPTRKELTKKLKSEGYEGIFITDIKRKTYAGERLDRHQNVAIYYESKQERSETLDNIVLFRSRRHIFPGSYVSAAGS